MPMTPVSLGVRSNPGRDTAISAARLINCFAEDAGEEGKIKYPIVACDGFSSFATLVGAAAGVTRGMLNLDDTTLYVVTGTRLQRVDTAGSVTHMAELATGGYAYFARNRKEPNAQVALVTSDGLFRLIENNTVTTPSLASDIGASLFNSVCSIDGYFIFTKSNGEFYISAIDGSAVDDLDFAATQANPDGLTRGVIRGRDVCLFGPRSVEFWQNTGATDFPFERTTATQIGLYAPASAVPITAVIDGTTADTVAFVGANVTGDLLGVMLLSGYEGRKISGPALDRAIRSEPTPSSIRAFTYTARGGHTFYCLTGSSFTWEYNCGTGFWHERTSSGLSFWRVVDACTFNGATIYGDYSSAVLYQRFAFLTPASASNCTLRHSNDNGDSWTSARSKTIGGSTASKTRVKFNRLGQSKEDGKVVELAITNAVVENGTGNPMTIIPPALHAWPNPMRFHTLYVDVIPGASLTSGPKGVIGLAVDAEVVKG
jgi:hypothetical protein